MRPGGNGRCSSPLTTRWLRTQPRRRSPPPPPAISRWGGIESLTRRRTTPLPGRRSIWTWALSDELEQAPVPSRRRTTPSGLYSCRPEAAAVDGGGCDQLRRPCRETENLKLWTGSHDDLGRPRRGANLILQGLRGRRATNRGVEDGAWTGSEGRRRLWRWGEERRRGRSGGGALLYIIIL